MRQNKTSFLNCIIILTAVFLISGCGKKDEQLGSVEGMEYLEIGGITFYADDFFREKKLALVVNATLWDPVSVEQIRVLNRIQRKYNSDELGILVVMHETDSRRHDTGELKNSENRDFPFIMANDRAVKVFCKENTVPTILVIENGNIIRRQIKGYINDENLESIVKKYLKVAEL